MKHALRLLNLMPAALDLAWMRWARAELQKHAPCHPDLPDVVRRIAYLEQEICRG